MAADLERCTPQGVPYSTLPHMVNADGQYLFCRTWEPSLEPGQKPRALLFLVHGYGSHSGVLGPIVAKLLNRHGFLVFSHDHVGHGQSEGERVYVDDFGLLARDLLQHVDIMVLKYPDVPVFLIGHSIGGAIAMTASCERPGFFRGMVLSGPAVENYYTKPYIGWNLLWILANIWPSMSTGPSVPDRLTKDLAEAKKYGEDPLVFRGDYSLYTSFMCLQEIRKTGQALLPKVECPFLIVHGEDDELIDVSGSWKLYEQARSQDKEIKTYPNCRHVLLLESPEDAEKVKQDILTWLLARVDPGKIP